MQLGASTIPSSYILPEILPQYGKLHPDTYFVVHQSDSSDITKGLLNGLYDIGMVGMHCADESLHCIPFYKDRMVLITPVSDHFLKMKDAPTPPIMELLREPIILREKGSGSQKSADLFLESVHIPESELKITARINDQESIKNLVVGGLGVSIISEKAVQNLAREKRVLLFELPPCEAERNLYLVFHRNSGTRSVAAQFATFVQQYYTGLL